MADSDQVIQVDRFSIQSPPQFADSFSETDTASGSNGEEPGDLLKRCVDDNAQAQSSRLMERTTDVLRGDSMFIPRFDDLLDRMTDK